VCFTQRAREGKFHFFSPPLDSSAQGGEKWKWGREMDSEEMETLKREEQLVDMEAMHT
jgi:hypothetical protein